MSRQHLSILVIVTIALAIVAALVAHFSRPDQTALVGERVYPELEARINDIVRIESQTAGHDKATIVLEDDVWRVSDRAGYPANSLHLRQNLLVMARLELVEEKTKIPSKYEIIGVQNVEDAEDTTQSITLYDAENNILADLIVGKVATGGQNYVRRNGEAQSWLASNLIHMPENAAEWLDMDLFDVDEDRIKRVKVTPPADAVAYEIEKASEEDKGFTLSPLAEDMKASFSQVGRLARVFDGQRLKDVMTNAAADEQDAPWTTVNAETFDGLLLEIKARKVDDQFQIQGTARATDEASEEVRKEASMIAERMQGWTYVMASYRAAPMLADYENLVEEVEEE